MTRAALVFVVLLGAAAVGCEDDTRGLDGGPLDTGVTVDSGPTELPPCEGYLWTLDADGLVVGGSFFRSPSRDGFVARWGCAKLPLTGGGR